MNYYEILKAIQQLNNNDGIATTEYGDEIIINIGVDRWKLKTIVGWIEYSTLELAKTLSEWEKEIYMIGF